jgi:uncharacterized protein (TIGR03067 family)
MSRCFSFFVVLACLASAAGRAPADDPKGQKPEAALNGSWTLASLEVDGEKLSPETIANATMTVKDGKYTFKMHEDSEEGTFKVDSSKKPAQIDLDIQTGESKGKKQLGIYEVDATTWKLCLTEPGESTRPSEIHAKQGSKQLLFIFKKKS